MASACRADNVSSIGILEAGLHLSYVAGTRFESSNRAAIELRPRAGAVVSIAGFVLSCY